MSETKNFIEEEKIKLVREERIRDITDNIVNGIKNMQNYYNRNSFIY